MSKGNGKISEELSYTRICPPERKRGWIDACDFVLRPVVSPLLRNASRLPFRGVLIVAATGRVRGHSWSIEPGIDSLFLMDASRGSSQ